MNIAIYLSYICLIYYHIYEEEFHDSVIHYPNTGVMIQRLKEVVFDNRDKDFIIDHSNNKFILNSTWFYLKHWLEISDKKMGCHEWEFKTIKGPIAFGKEH